VKVLKKVEIEKDLEKIALLIQKQNEQTQNFASICYSFATLSEK
jgi:hypothetical protein